MRASSFAEYSQLEVEQLSQIESLLIEFEDIFQELNFLPPVRSYDHGIPSVSLLSKIGNGKTGQRDVTARNNSSK